MLTGGPLLRLADMYLKRMEYGWRRISSEGLPRYPGPHTSAAGNLQRPRNVRYAPNSDQNIAGQRDDAKCQQMG
jgi:hypothetical protein